MNDRVTSFFVIFASMLALQHILALATGAKDEWAMLINALLITIGARILIGAVDLFLLTWRRNRLKAIKPPHEHHWRHWYDTNGYYADQPHINVPSRVFYCITCREVHRAIIVNTQGAHHD